MTFETDNLLESHLRRVGEDEMVMRDTLASLQVKMLRDFLRVTRAALADEGVDAETAQRVIQLVLYGAVPQRHAAELRITEREQRIRDIAHEATTPTTPWVT